MLFFLRFSMKCYKKSHLNNLDRPPKDTCLGGGVCFVRRSLRVSSLGWSLLVAIPMGHGSGGGGGGSADGACWTCWRKRTL